MQTRCGHSSANCPAPRPPTTTRAMRGSKRASSRHAMEWASGWFKILAATARERPGAAAAAGIGAAAALPAALVVMVTAFAVASAVFFLLALPLGAATAAWWLATGREMPSLSHHLRRDRANDSVLSSVSEVSVEADDVVAAGDRPADLILVHAGQREYAMEGCDNAARMVAERVAATVEHTTTRAVSVVDIAVLCSVGADEVARAFRPGGSRALAFVVESAVCTEDPSDELRKFRRALVASGGALLADARVTVVAVSRSVAPEGDKWCGPRAGGRAGAEFRAALAKLPARTAQLCAGCDAEIEHNGPGVVDRWTAEVLVPALAGDPPLPPRVLSLSSSHTALLCRHLGARDVLVGCDAHFADDDDADPSEPRLPRVDPWAPDEATVRRLAPTLILCAYDSTAEALRDASPRWRLDGERDAGPPLGSFEVATLRCPLGRDATRAAAAQFAELAALVRVAPETGARAGAALRDGLLALRARAEMELRARWNSAQPFVFLETDPELYSADGCTPLGAALAEALGVGNIADESWDDPSSSSSGAASRANAAPTHYPRLPAQRFWSPREPDWWIVAHPTRSGAAKTSFPDTMDEEDRKRHAALREGRLVHLSDALCHAASQWTPELVDVASAVLDAMVAEASARATRLAASAEETAETGREADAEANATANAAAAAEKKGSSKARPSRAPKGSYVGATPADRDAATLRAQLEPWSTFALRRRLAEDFHQAPTDPETAQRPEVMRRLLECYDAEGGAEGRAVVDVAGTPVDPKICEEILVELRGWLSRRGKSSKGDRYDERPSVCADAYMIIRSPADFEAKLGAGSRKSRQAANGFERHARLWELARSAVRSVDPAFADAFTALAVTSQFRGSPHVDKQNAGPFYGLALGDFEAGTGGICVECDARTIARVDTKNRLGKIDGRFPHWVAPYSQNAERFSLIFYRTVGEPTPITVAVFDADLDLRADI